MKLEEEIMQPKFSNEYQKMVVNLAFTGSWLNIRTNEILKPYKLTIQQYNVLRILRGRHPEPSTVNLIIERMLDKMSNASRIVDRLVVKKLVQRNICPEDRRRVDINITDKGMNLLDRIDAVVDEWQKSFSPLNLKEAKELNRLLDKLRG